VKGNITPYAVAVKKEGIIVGDLYLGLVESLAILTSCNGLTSQFRAWLTEVLLVLHTDDLPKL